MFPRNWPLAPMPGNGVRGCGSLNIELREEQLFIKTKTINFII